MFSAKKLSAVTFTVAECSVPPFAPALLIHHHNRLARILVRAAQLNVVLIDGQHFTISSGSHKHQGACCRGRIERALDGVKIASSIRRNIQRLVLWRNRTSHLRSRWQRGEGNKARIAVKRLAGRQRLLFAAQSHRRPWAPDCRRSAADRDIRVLDQPCGMLPDRRQTHCSSVMA